jgi:hypothetical protein
MALDADTEKRLSQLELQQRIQSEALYRTALELTDKYPDDPMTAEVRTWVNALNPDSFTFPPKADPPPPGGGLQRSYQYLTALDTSSHTGLDISDMVRMFGATHVIPHLYMPGVESAGLDFYSITQAQQARALGCTVGGYMWCFGKVNPEAQVDAAMATAERAGIKLGPTNPLWLDCETYSSKGKTDYDAGPCYPDSTGDRGWWLRRAIERVKHFGVQPGIYTGYWWWTSDSFMQDTTEFGDNPLWASQFNANTAVDSVLLYGGWSRETLYAKQWKAYTPRSVDVSTFDTAVCIP